MAKGKKGKKSKQDEDAEWDKLEEAKAKQAPEPKAASEPKKGLFIFDTYICNMTLIYIISYDIDII